MLGTGFMYKKTEKILNENSIEKCAWNDIIEQIHNGSFVRFKKIIGDRLSEEQSKVLYQKIKKSLNLKEHYLPVEDSLGIPRYKMPQIRGEDRTEFFGYLQSKGHKITRCAVKLKSIKCTQRELNAFNIEKKIKKIQSREVYPIIISKDNYILDGHHNFKAASIININATYPCFRVSLNIHELLKVACSFHKTEFEEFQ
jgi:hypothetical protein